ncbi:MAG: Cysteine desulfuration protein SufE [Turneriella sp.]|nr:Cysteine desulfuration protein SufE [Turneriella sp.]
MSIEEREASLVENFETFDDWADRYRYLIELGEELPALDEVYKTTENKVQGCQSQVWLIARRDGDKIIFEADSDSAITRGLIALLVKLFSGANASEIAAADLSFIERLGFAKHLSMSRANGFASMIQKIKRLASSI